MCSACLFTLCLHVCGVLCVCVLLCCRVGPCALVCVCVLRRDASSALRCMAGEDRTNENAAEGRLIRQRAVRRRTDPPAPIISAWTLRRGNCVCVFCASRVLFARRVHLLRALSDACGTCGCSKYQVKSNTNRVLFAEVTVCLRCRRRCCCNTSRTPASRIRPGKRHWTSPVNLDALR